MEENNTRKNIDKIANGKIVKSEWKFSLYINGHSETNLLDCIIV